MTDRLPPHNLDAEAAVLGACLMDAAALDTALEKLVEEDFFKGSHRLVFRACKVLAGRSEIADIISVQDRLIAEGALEAAGGYIGLASLSEKTASSTNVEAYCKIVKKKAQLRAVLATCSQISADVYARPEEAAEVIDAAENAILEIGKLHGSSASTPVDELVMGTIKALDAMAKHGDGVTGVPTGIHRLDYLTAGMQPGQLIIVAGRPGSGKTALALNIAEHVAFDKKKPVALFSLEMTNDELLIRLLSGRARVNSFSLRIGRMSAPESDRLVRVTNELYSTKGKLFINDSGDLSIQTLRASVRRLVKEKKVELVVVDYLQLIGTDGRFENRTQEVTYISKALKAIAKEMRVPVLVASQLNRGVEARQGSKTESLPRLSDLRESGSIEQDADVVMLLHRKKKAEDDMSPEPDNTAKLILAKQRSGPTDDMDLIFRGEYTRFENPAQQPVNPEAVAGRDWSK